MQKADATGGLTAGNTTQKPIEAIKLTTIKIILEFDKETKEIEISDPEVKERSGKINIEIVVILQRCVSTQNFTHHDINQLFFIDDKRMVQTVDDLAKRRDSQVSITIHKVKISVWNNDQKEIFKITIWEPTVITNYNGSTQLYRVPCMVNIMVEIQGKQNNSVYLA